MSRHLGRALGALLLLTVPVGAQGASLNYRPGMSFKELLEWNGTPFELDSNPWDYDVLATILLGLGSEGVDPHLITPAIFMDGTPANGEFETGSLDPWTAVAATHPSFGPTVGGVDFPTPLGLVQPLTGEFSFIHDWDSTVGGEDIFLRQTFRVPYTAEDLLFDFRAAWNLVGLGATQARRFEVRLRRVSDGTVLFQDLFLEAPPETATMADPPVQHGVVPLDPWRDEQVELEFRWTVPEAMTGPAWFQLDSVRVSEDLAVALDHAPPGEAALRMALLAPNDAGFIRLAWSLGAPVWNEQAAVAVLTSFIRDELGCGDPQTGWLRVGLNHLVPVWTEPVDWMGLPEVITLGGMFWFDPWTVTLTDQMALNPNPRVVTPFGVPVEAGKFHTLDRPLLPLPCIGF